MKQLILFALLLLAANTQAQEVEPQKSLLWKIEHPNSEKTSYLYGTMHISGRLAYHLGEEFFNALESTDAVALDEGKEIYMKNCVACHGNEGQGGVGPNLADDYSIHGASVNENRVSRCRCRKGLYLPYLSQCSSRSTDTSHHSDVSSNVLPSARVMAT